MTHFLVHLMLLTLTALATLNLGVVGLTRAVQMPLPPLLYSTDGRLHLFETNCADYLAACIDRDRLLLEGLDVSFPVAQWSPDGAFIAVRMPEEWLIYRADCLLNALVCEPHRFDPDANPNVRLAWGPDGSALAYGVEQYEREWLRVRSRGCWDGSPPEACIEQNVSTAGGFPIQPDWSRDGSRLTFVGGTFLDIYLADLVCLDTGDACPSYAVTREQETELWPSLSAGGTQVIYVLEQISVAQIFLLDIETGQRRQLTSRAASSIQPDWSAGDRYIAYAGFAPDNVGLTDIYLLDLPRALHFRLIRSAERDMFPNWGP